MKLSRLFIGLMMALSILLVKVEDSRASHAMGFDYSFLCLGGDTFVITASFYRDCGGIPAPTTVDLTIGAPANAYGSFCASPFTVNLPLINCQEVSPVCPAQINQTTCNGGNLPGVQQCVYSDTIIFPQQCPNWIVSYSHCCRNGLITTLQNPQSQNMYAEALINNAGGLCNNSPIFTSLPVPFICANQQYNYNHGVIDFDGDSIVYELINPRTSATGNILYVPPFTIAQPLATTGPFLFDPATGQMSFTPSGPQVAVVTIRVYEYRNGVLIGFVERDIQIVVINCTNNQPQLTGIINFSGGAGANLVDSLTVQICPDFPIQFNVQAFDPDVNDQITITTNLGQAIPGAVLTQQVISNNQILLDFQWTPTALDTGLNTFSITVSDDACPILGQQVYSFSIFVLPGTFGGPDLFYCPAGGPVQLNAVGGNTFTWSPATGLSDPNIRNPLASPSVTTTYVVVSDLDTLCKNTDTVTVFVVPDFIIFSVTDDDTICKFGSTQLAIFTDPVWGPYTYSWSPVDGLSNPNSAITAAQPLETTTYVITATSDTGCVQKDSVTVHVIGQAPLVTITASPNNVCPGDIIQLDGGFNVLTCGATSIGCGAANPPTMTQVGTTATSITTPFQGTSQDGRYQMLFRAAELNAAGINSGIITRLAIDVATKVSSNPYENFTIKMGCTTSDVLTNNSWITPVTQVYTTPGLVTFIGWNIFNLQTGYDWDGVQNLVIEFCWDNGTTSPGGVDGVNGSNVGYTASARNYLNSTAGCSISPAFSYNVRPNLRFWHCSAPVSNYNISWSPAAGLSDPTILNPTVALFQNQTYVLTVADSFCEGVGFINLAVDSSYFVNATNDTLVCGSDSVQLLVDIIGNPPASVLSCGANNTICSNPNQIKQFGTGTQTLNTASPYFGFYEDGRVQYLIRASELAAAGFNVGTISALAFNVTSKQSTQPYNGFTIKIGCTNQNTLNTNAFTTIGMTTVFGPSVHNTFAGWNLHTFHTPFDWDGLTNLIVEVCFDNNSWTSTDIVAATTAFSNSTIYDFADFDVGCSLGFPTGNNLRPNMRFTICDAPPAQITYSWSPGHLLNDSTIADPIAHVTSTTTFSVAVTFVNGCVRYDTVTVSTFPFNPVVSNDTAVCVNNPVQLFASGGNSYSWTPAFGLSCTNCPNPVATPQASTTYYVTILDNNSGCQIEVPVNISVTAPIINFPTTAAICASDSIVLDAGPGHTSYFWQDGHTGQFYTVTSPGQYWVIVTDATGCTNSDTITVLFNQPPVIPITPDTTICEGDFVTLDAGPGFSSYLWSTGDSTRTTTVNAAGVYSVTVVDVAGCPGSDSVTVSIGTPSFFLGPDIMACGGETVVLSAGAGVQSVLWSTGATTPSISVTLTDNYWADIVDAFGCSARDTIFVDFYAPINVSIGPNQFACFGDPVTFDAGQGWTSYLWSNLAVTQTITVTTAGTYSVTVTDANNCTATSSAQLINYNNPVNISGVTDICDGDTLILDAGPGWVTYLWQDNSSNSFYPVTTSGTYSVTVTDVNGCISTDQVTVSVNPNPNPVISGPAAVCVGNIYTLDAGVYSSWYWSSGAGTQTIEITQGGTYSVTVTDDKGCIGVASIQISEYPSPDPGLVDNVCLSESVTISAATGFASYLWSNGGQGQSVVVSAPGTYYVTVTDNNGCEAVDSVVVNTVLVTASATPVEIGEGDASNLSATVVEGNPPYTYVWNPANSLDLSDPANPVATPDVTTTYTVSVTDANGCIGIDTVTVVVQTIDKYVVPAAFTPNSDGQNDFFEVLTLGNVNIKEFKVFNRWGQVIYDNISAKWDGTYKGENQPVGTYVYYLVLEIKGNTITETNAFSLIR